MHISYHTTAELREQQLAWQTSTGFGSVYVHCAVETYDSTEPALRLYGAPWMPKTRQ